MKACLWFVFRLGRRQRRRWPWSFAKWVADVLAGGFFGKIMGSLCNRDAPLQVRKLVPQTFAISIVLSLRDLAY